MNYIRILSYNAWDVANYVANNVMSNHIAKHTNLDIKLQIILSLLPSQLGKNICVILNQCLKLRTNFSMKIYQDTEGLDQ